MATVNTFMDHVLESIFIEQTGLKASELFPDSRLEQDCGITGDDVVELLDVVNEKFKVDFSSFEFEMYFHGECEYYIGALFNRKRERHRKAFPVTIGHICNVVEKGKWFKPSQVKAI